MRSEGPWPRNTVAVPATFVAVTGWDGLGYTLGPPGWSASPSLAAFAVYPGGIRSYGVALLTVCALLAVGLHSHDLRLVRLGLAGCVAVYLTLSLTVLGSWAIDGIAAWGGPSKGLGLAMLAALVLRRTPDSRRCA